MINTNIIQQIMFTDTIALLIKEKSKENYVIIKTDAPELKAITVSLWINTTQNDKEVFFITYAAGDSKEEENAFAIFTRSSNLTLTIANKQWKSQQVRKHAFPKEQKVKKSNLKMVHGLICSNEFYTIT